MEITTSQIQTQNTLNDHPLNNKVIVWLDKNANIKDLLHEWEQEDKYGKITEMDSSKRPENLKQTLFLLECEREDTVTNLIADYPLNTEPNQGVVVTIHGRKDEAPPDTEIDSDDDKFKDFRNNSNMPPISNNGISLEKGLLDKVFENEVTVCMLDTGVNQEAWNTDKLIIREKDEKTGQERSLGYDYTPDNKVGREFLDEHGHGTFGMKVITGGVPTGKLKVIPFKIFDIKGEGTFFNMICAIYHIIDYAITHEVDIINLSAGFRESVKYIPAILLNMIEKAKQKGIFIVVSAGNGIKNGDKGVNLDKAFKSESKKTEQDNGLTTTWLPATLQSSNIISVASLNFNYDKAEVSRSNFSNYSKERVSVATYGENIPNKIAEIPYGTSVATFYTTKALAAVISKYKSEYHGRNTYIEDIRDKFNAMLQDCPPKATETAAKYLNYSTFFEKLSMTEDVYS